MSESGRRVLSHHDRSPALAVLADEIANQADADLQAALTSSCMGVSSIGVIDAGVKGHAHDPTPSTAAYSPFRVRTGSQPVGSARPVSSKTFTAMTPHTPTASQLDYAELTVLSPRAEVVPNARHAVKLGAVTDTPALRKQFRGTPRTPRDTAASTEAVVEVFGGGLLVQRSVSHTVRSNALTAAEQLASRSVPVLDDFSAVRAELAKVSSA